MENKRLPTNVRSSNSNLVLQQSSKVARQQSRKARQAGSHGSKTARPLKAAKQGSKPALGQQGSKKARKQGKAASEREGARSAAEAERDHAARLVAEVPCDATGKSPQRKR